MRIIVLGGTGLVGSALVDALASDQRVQTVVTPTRRPANHGSAKVDNQVVDFQRLTDHRNLFTGDALCLCLGTTRARAGSLAAQRQVDLTYQAQAATMAAEQGVGHCLVVSSSGADSGSSNAYLRMKGELEDLVCALPFARVSLFQPSLLLGTRDHSRPAEQLASLVLPTLCQLPWLRRWRPIAGTAVARRMVQELDRDGPRVQRWALEAVFPD